MGSVMLPLFKILLTVHGEEDDTAAYERAWRTVCILPAIATIGVGWAVMIHSEDAPRGNYKDLKRSGWMPEVSIGDNFRYAACNTNTWLLTAQYACCFGVELTVNNGAALYFYEEFNLSAESAAAIASIFGWMNIFARAMGGFMSDWINSLNGMRGRLLLQTLLLAAEGLSVLTFAHTRNLFEAIVVLVFFSIFVQASEGSTFAIVPYIDPPVTGTVAGIIGAGGSAGAVAFGFCFQRLIAAEAFELMGYLILGSTLMSFFVVIPDHAALLWGKDSQKVLVASGRTVAAEHAHREDSELEIEETGIGPARDCFGDQGRPVVEGGQV